MGRRGLAKKSPKTPVFGAHTPTRQLLLSEAWAPIAGRPQRQGPSSPCRDGNRDGAPDDWPPGLADYLHDNVRLQMITFDTEESVEPCCCLSPCRFTTCSNAEAYFYCSKDRCSYEGRCGNSLLNFPKLFIQAHAGTRGFGVFAGERIARGVIIGEYLGEMTIGRPCENRGYLLRMKARAREAPSKRVYIDASRSGNTTRFMNHSCRSNTSFEELSNDGRHTVVVVTRRVIDRGEEVTVDYGNELGFACKCGEAECRGGFQG